MGRFFIRNGALWNHVLEKETRLKQNENTDTCLNSNVESSSMEGERNASDDRLTKEGKIIEITPIHYLNLNIFIKFYRINYWIVYLHGFNGVIRFAIKRSNKYTIDPVKQL